MTEAILYNTLKVAYTEIQNSLSIAKRAAFEYEVYMSDLEHKMGNGIVVENVDEYFNNLINAEDEKDKND